jgi:hypothetical protein
LFREESGKYLRNGSVFGKLTIIRQNKKRNIAYLSGRIGRTAELRELALVTL